ncbi:MAG: hypothetical protein K0U29_02030 [Gammaproteobacteria bacterium]|nr:hypothetical protein [Gammaproteobacteria bacterium]MCH9743688.1 hypothetical protein [Gammaproteobacteria bacterium]
MPVQGAFIHDIDTELVIAGEPKGEYKLYRAEGKNSIDGFHTTTIYVHSVIKGGQQSKPLELKKLENKLITVSIDIDFKNVIEPYKDIIIAGYARSLHSFMMPQDLFISGKKHQINLFFYKIELVSNYWRLTQDRNNCVYAGKTPETGITVQKALTDVFEGLKKTGLKAEEYDLSKITGDAAKTVMHHCFVQYNESTHEFIRRLMLIGNIFAYDDIKDGKPCRVFVDDLKSSPYQAYTKYKQAVYHDYDYQLPILPKEQVRVMDGYFNTTLDGNQYGLIRQPATYWLDKPFKIKQFGFYMHGMREEINVTKVNWHQYDPDDYSQKIAGEVGEKGQGFAPEYTVYSQGTKSGFCKDQSTALLDRLKSNTFVHLHSTVPVTRVGHMLETSPDSRYKKELKIPKNYAVYETVYRIGYPEHTHVLYANQDKYFPDMDSSLWHKDFFEFNFELTCLPEKNYPPLMSDVSESPAVGKFLDALVVNKDGKNKASSDLNVSTNEVGDVYMGLFLERKAQQKKFAEFTPVRAKMNTTNGNVTPMVDTPAAVMIHEFGGMLVYCGQRHDHTNKPIYKPEQYDYLQRHDKKKPEPAKQLCVLFDYAKGKETLSTLSAYDVVVTAQNDIKGTSEKDTVHIAKGAYKVQSTKEMLLKTDDKWTADSKAAMLLKTEATYTLNSTSAASFKANSDMNFKCVAWETDAQGGIVLKGGSTLTINAESATASGKLTVAGKVTGGELVAG